jgi:Fe-S cluster biogenesis protein NfuA
LLSLIPLAAIYLLKVRPVRKPTTAWFLWEDIFQDKKTTSLFQRFRDLFSLLLMMLAFAAIVFAMTRPSLSGDSRQDLVLLIDNSASMSAMDGGTTRLEQAKKVASEIIVALNGTQRCSVATVSDQANFLSNLTDNPRELLSAVERIQPTVLESNIDSLKQLAGSDSQRSQQEPSTGANAEEVGAEQVGGDLGDEQGRAGERDSRLILISDGCFPETLPTGIELMKVGGDSEGNIGIVACDMRRLPGGSNRVGVFFQVASNFQRTVEAEITLGFGQPDQLTKFIPLTVEPGLNPPDVFEIENAEAGKWFMQLEIFPQDGLKADDIAYIALPPRRSIPVAVAAEDRYFYENCVQAFSGNDGLLSLTELNDDSAQVQLLVGAGGFAIPEGYDGDLLIFQPGGESKFWQEVGEEIEVVEPQAVDPNHPAIRHIDATLLPFVGAKRITAPSGAEILVKAEDGTPLIYRATSAGRSAIVLNFDPLASDFYFSAWFPVVVYSSAAHLAGREQELPASFKTGQRAIVPGVDAGEASKLVSPNGTVMEIRETSFGPLDEVGFYELNNASGDWLSGSSLLSATETLIGNAEVKETATSINRGTSPMAWLTLLAIAVLAGESILYQRRKVG